MVNAMLVMLVLVQSTLNKVCASLANLYQKYKILINLFFMSKFAMDAMKKMKLLFMGIIQIAQYLSIYLVQRIYKLLLLSVVLLVWLFCY